MLAYLLAALVLIVAAALAFGIAFLFHLQGLAYIMFVSLILILGITAAIVIIVLHHRARKQRALEGEGASAEAKAELDLLLNDANRKLRDSQQGAKTLEFLPLIYVLGDADSAKTTTVIQSGLEPELLSGSVSHDSTRVPTQVLNLWYTRQAVLLEIGQSIRQNNALLARLVHRTRATAYRSAFGAGAPPRAVIVCLSSDQLLQAGGTDSLIASARGTGSQLREISRILGMQVPVYVIVTKLDRVPHFEQYVRNLTDDEVRQVLGTSLGRIDSSAGTYADQASRSLSGAVDSLVFKLGGFRVEMLDRENDSANVPCVYEFPRELGKLRKNLSQYLVELCKPSQLSANPYLRGFYFTGVRARIVERTATSPAPVAVEVPAAKDAGATQFLNLAAMRASAASQPAVPVITSTRIPQWTFLPRLLPEVILADKSALAPTRQSAPARLFRRILFGTLAFAFALFTFFVLLSYFKNAALERHIRNDAQALQVAGPESASVPTLTDLNNLDDLRQVIVRLDEYQQNGRPLSYSFGLYQGEKLRENARRIYFDRFRPFFLNPTQLAFLQHLKALPDVPQATSDISSYLDAYNPLKAYLITTNHPEKSQPAFLAPIFFKYWTDTRPIDSDQQQLAQKQIDFYGDELLRQPPYSISPDLATVTRAQAYLSKFLANTRIYQNMLNDADKKNPRGVDFNKQYPEAVHYISDSHVVRGAFSRDGFAFMQDALQHPERYAQGETWVLGNQGAAGLDTAGLAKDLTAQYSSDYSKEWHQFLLSAHVAPCGGIREAPKELDALSKPASPILELLFVVSHNTAVANPAIKNVFQPAQIIVDPNATDQLVGSGNKDYIKALGDLGLNVEQAAKLNPAIATDAAAFAQQISPSILAAKQVVKAATSGFNFDKDTHTETLVGNLLLAPVDCIDRLEPSPGAAAGAGGAKICNAINPLLAKYPFLNSASAAQAAVPEVDAVFAPDTGVLATTLSNELKLFLTQAGSQYMQAPNAPAPLNPHFPAYINRAVHVSNELYAPGQKNASFTFSLQFIPGGGVTTATVDVDGQRLATGSTPQKFTWNVATAQKASVTAEGQESSFTGKWSVFELVRAASRISHSATGYKLEYNINTATTFAGHAGASGSKVATFELSGPGADLLVGDAFTGLTCVKALNK